MEMLKCVKRWTGIMPALLAFLFVLFGVNSALAATLTVGSGGSYVTIQAAIDAAAPGDTIQVAPGTYNEFLNINKDNLIIQSTGGAAVTIVNIKTRTSGQGGVIGGIVFYNNGIVFDGFTVQDFTIQSGEIKIVRITGNQNTLRNCVFRGNIALTSTNRTDYGILVYGSDNNISDNEIYDIGYTGINVVAGPWSDAEGNTISNNILHDIGTPDSFSYGITIDRSSNNKLNIVSNQFYNMLGGETKSWAIVVWGQMAEGTNISGHNLTNVPNGISLTSASGVYVVGNTIEVSNVGIRLFYSSWAGPVTDNNVIVNNTIRGGTTGLLINPNGGVGVIGPNNLFAFNNVYGNTMGAENLDTVPFNAINNWWGDATGPNATTNLPGLGNEVSDRIIFDPVLTAPVSGGGELSFDNPFYENGAAGLRVDLTFAGGDQGIGFVTILGDNPTGVGLFKGNFFNLLIADRGDISEAKVRLYYKEPSAKVPYWFDGENWVVCSDQKTVAGQVRIGGVTYDGYVEITIDDTTTPALMDMIGGAVIALRNQPLYDSVSGQSSCFIATAAFGSPFERHVQVLREFRDRYLLTNTAGRAFVRWYYRHSPRYAAIIAHNESLRTSARIMLMPLYGVALLAMKGGVVFYLLLGLGLLLLAYRKRMVKAVTATLVALLVLGFSTGAYAADGNIFDLAAGEEYTVALPTTHTVGQSKVSVDFFYCYGNKTLEATLVGNDMDLVKEQHLLQAGLTFGLGENQQLSLVVPYVAHQGSEVAGTGTSGMGDLSLTYKFRFPSNNENGLNFAIAPYLQLDTAEEDIYMDAGSTVLGLRGIMDKRFSEKLIWTANLGYAHQFDEAELSDEINIENTLLFGTGLTFLIPNKPSYVTVEIFGRSEDLFDTENTPVEAIVSYGYAMEHGTFTIGGGMGLVDGYGASDWRLFTGFRLKI